MSERLSTRGIDGIPHQQEALPIEEVDMDELAIFFKAGYGSAYKGDERLRKKIGRSSQVVTLRDSHRGIAAAALIEGRRILSPGTSPDRERFGKRQSNMVELFQACFEQADAQWITIGEQYDRMQVAATDAGMQRADDKELIYGLLREASVDQNYKVASDDRGGLVVVKVTSETRPDYRQQLWVHIPESSTSSD